MCTACVIQVLLIMILYVNQVIQVRFMLQMTGGDPQGELNPKLAFEFVGRIACLVCSRPFSYFASFAKHVKWCGREVRYLIIGTKLFM